MYSLLECHVNLDIDGFNDVNAEGEPKGIKLPYIGTIEESSKDELENYNNILKSMVKKYDKNNINDIISKYSLKSCVPSIKDIENDKNIYTITTSIPSEIFLDDID